MSIRKIKAILAKKGIPFIEVRFVPGNWMGQNEWYFELSEETKIVLIEASKGTEDELELKDFLFMGGDMENVMDSLDLLPSLNTANK